MNEKYLRNSIAMIESGQRLHTSRLQYLEHRLEQFNLRLKKAQDNIEKLKELLLQHKDNGGMHNREGGCEE